MKGTPSPFHLSGPQIHSGINRRIRTLWLQFLSRVAGIDILRHLLLPLWRHLCGVFRPWQAARSKLLTLNIVL
jgi:hypothetical protein